MPENSQAILPENRPQDNQPQRDSLNRFVKGQSGNPGGRPKGLFSKHTLRELKRKAASGDLEIAVILKSLISKAAGRDETGTVKPQRADVGAAEFLRCVLEGPMVANDKANEGGGQQVVVIIENIGQRPPNPDKAI